MQPSDFDFDVITGPSVPTERLPAPQPTVPAREPAPQRPR